MHLLPARPRGQGSKERAVPLLRQLLWTSAGEKAQRGWAAGQGWGGRSGASGTPAEEVPLHSTARCARGQQEPGAGIAGPWGEGLRGRGELRFSQGPAGHCEDLNCDWEREGLRGWRRGVA